MRILGELTVLPSVPEELARLNELAHNLYWSWNADVRALFRRLDENAWAAARGNPVAFLREIEPARLAAAAADPAFLAEYERVIEKFDAYLSAGSWYGAAVGEDHLYAYLCAEYGWTETVALYSGGLGVLAGDHTKAASDLGVPLVAVGLYYPEGYFHQRVADDGTQEAVYVRADLNEMPFRRAFLPSGEPLRINVNVFGEDVSLEALEARVGKVRVILLDSDVEGNEPEARQLLSRLYGGDQRTRVAQEMLLGIGGVRILRALQLEPSAWHVNEGHSAFSVLERCRELVEAGLGFEEARAAVTASTLFTVHTPVAAGNDAFSFDLMQEAFGSYWAQLGLRREEFMRLGEFDHGWGPLFSMPALAIRFTSGRNGVAELHGDTSRRIWAPLFPGVPRAEVPIGHVTNGVHIGTWVAPEIRELLTGTLGIDMAEGRAGVRMDDDAWQRVRDLDPAAFFDARRKLKARSVRFLRRRLKEQLMRHEATATSLHRAATLLDPAVLTVGFARRFATYKRATLIFSDLERLASIVNAPERPVQLLFAGKAHPADLEGQRLVQEIQNLSKDPRFAERVLFVEDYDMAVGRALTRGVDVWLNNPRRPQEASGTSGMKAAMNGVLNLSILDGWWPEGFDGCNGWAIGGPESHRDEARGDAADADALYTLLEEEVVPLYYDRGPAGVPLEWVRRSLDAVATITPRFNAARMVSEYVNRYYAPAARRGKRMSDDGYAAARELAAWLKHVREAWPSVRLSADPLPVETVTSGDELTVRATLATGELKAEVRVELLYGPAGAELEEELIAVPLTATGERSAAGAVYVGAARPNLSGALVYGIRAYPVNDLLASPFDAGALLWAQPQNSTSVSR